MFARFCSQCHGQDGRGGPARNTMPVIPDFTDHAWQQSHSKGQLIVSILEGKDRLMPANRGMVSEELAADLVAHVRTFDPLRPVPVQAAPAGTVSTEAASAEIPSGDFEVEFSRLVNQFDDLKRQERGLVSTPAPATISAVSTGAAPALAGAASAAPAAPAAAVAPVADRPFTPDDVARGRELFLGHRSLANGGPACIGCHAVYGSGWPEGGRLGPNLTKAYERLGGRTALSANLQALATPTMRPAYRQHALESEEVLALTAYLEEADRKGVEDASPLPVRFLLLGLGGAVLGLTSVTALWGSRSRARARPPLNGQAAPALPPSRPDLTASPPDYAGLGL
jgi:mono/diheme cytochrome c family protein